MKTIVLSWINSLTSDADTMGIKVKEIVIADKSYGQLIKELTFCSRLKPGAEHVDEVSITSYAGILKVTRDKT